MIDDDTPLIELLLLVCTALGVDDGEVSAWIAPVVSVPGLETVREIKGTINTPEWENVQLPVDVKTKIQDLLMEQPPSVLSDDQADKSTCNQLNYYDVLIQPQENGDTESETILFRRDRHASVISPVVLSILSGDTKTTDIDEEEDSIGEGNAQNREK